MPDEPISEKPYAPTFPSEQHGTLTWSWALDLLQTSRNFWLATTRPDGRPHLAPIWCLWHDDALYFSTDPSTRKARNFVLNANVAVSTDGAGASVIVEGTVATEGDYDVRVRVAEAYQAKYDWVIRATGTGIAFDDGIETPLYLVRPTMAFGITDDIESKMTRWRFA